MFNVRMSHACKMVHCIGKCASNDIKMTLTGSRSKVHIYILHTSKRPKFSSVSLYGEPFSSYAPLFGKVQQKKTNDLDVKGKKYQYACYTPKVQIFASFPL